MELIQTIGLCLVLTILGIASAVEVTVGILAKTYTQGYYRFIFLPLPILGFIVLGILLGLQRLRNKFPAWKLLRLVLAIIGTVIVFLFGSLVLTKFSFPQLIPLCMMALMIYELLKAWLSVFPRWERKPRAKKAPVSSLYNHL